MNPVSKNDPGSEVLLMGNEAIARGAIEAGIQVCAAYPGNPSSEITGTLTKIGEELGVYVEWSVNEKVALEVAAAASFAGLRAMSTMKQNGLNVASDFLLNLNLSGCKGGLVVVVCDDPNALSSSNEEDSRAFARIGDLPLLEPSTFQEAKEMTRFAFELSEELGLPCLIRSVTRVSHARGNVVLDELPKGARKARFDTARPMVPLPITIKHGALHDKLEKTKGKFTDSGFNCYRGPDNPEMTIVTSGSGWMYALEAVTILGLKDRGGDFETRNHVASARTVFVRTPEKDRTRLFYRGSGSVHRRQRQDLLRAKCGRTRAEEIFRQDLRAHAPDR